MKKLFKEQKVSLYKVTRDLKLDNMRLYRYADGTCDIKNMPLSLLKTLSVYFGIGMYELYIAMIEYKNGGKND